MTEELLVQSPLLHLTIAPETQHITPGEAGTYVITVENRGPEAQAQTLEVRGLPPGWSKIEFDERRLAFPGEQRTATIIVSPPNDAPPALHHIEVWCRSGTAASGVSTTLDTLPADTQTPGPVAGLGSAPEVSLAPGLVVWRGEGQEERVVLHVRNAGGQEAEYSVSLQGLDASWYAVPARVRVAGQQSLETEIRLHPPARARPGDYPFSVSVAVDGRPNLAAEASGWLSLTGAAGRAADAAAPPLQQTPEPVAAAPPVQVAVVEVNLAPRSTFRFGPEDVSAQAIVTVQNRTRLVERYTLLLDGIPTDWFGLAISDIRLEAGASTQVPLRLTPRTGPGWPAGDYEFHLRVTPQSAPESAADLGGLISITGVANFDARLSPVQAEGRQQTFTLTLMNTGDLPLNLSLEASDPEKRCVFKVAVPRELQPGQESVLPVKVGARRSGIVGSRETFDFQIKVTPAGAAPSATKSYDARFVHKPSIGFRPVFIGGFLCALVAVVILIVLLATPAVSSAATWVGCQLDNSYRFSSKDPNPIRKPECGGRPRSEELDKWEKQPRSTLPGPLPDRRLAFVPDVPPSPDVLSLSAAIPLREGS